MNIFIESYGCTANQSDVCIAKHLIQNHKNYTLVDSIENADIILLFTCTVISATEQRMLSRIKQLHKMGKKIIVAGCMASIQQDIILQQNIPIQFISPRNIHQLIDILEKTSYTPTIEQKHKVKKNFSTLIAPIAISEGCDFSCSYCITTIARGKLTSYPIDSIQKDIINAIQNGCKEIQLTAQDTASYGIDIHSTLATLLQEISSIQGSYRIRLGMMNPATLYPQLKEMIKAYQNPHIYKFLHIPVQSGDNIILESMNRAYTIEQFTQIIDQFQKHIPTITISTDVIVGFPNETNEQFEKTKDLLTIIKPDIINITKFSARPFTKAKTMKGRIPTDIVKKRSQQLTSLSEHISYEKNKQHIGKTYTILINEKGKDNTVVGRSENYKPVVLKESIPLGEIIEIEVTDAKQTYLVGTLK